jgi:YD repeat-containing protein
MAKLITAYKSKCSDHYYTVMFDNNTKRDDPAPFSIIASVSANGQAVTVTSEDGKRVLYIYDEYGNRSSERYLY